MKACKPQSYPPPKNSIMKPTKNFKGRGEKGRGLRKNNI
jgi:hypothetical protein